MTEPSVRLRGMILAAGYGTRLAPLTDHVPKPLLPVRGKSLLDHAIAALDAAGIEKVAVNVHHLGRMISAHLEQRPDARRVHIVPETEILGTGGALDGARAFLGGADHFVIHNGDVLCDAPVSDLVRAHLAGGALATLLLVDWPAVNSVAVDPAGAVRRLGGDETADDPSWRCLTYTGIGVFSREFLDDIGPGFSSLIDPLDRAIARRPGSVRGLAPDDLVWSDLGTPGRYLAAVADREEASGGVLQVERMTGHGSDRRFWRLAGRDFSLAAMVSPAADPEFKRYAAIGAWLHEQGLGGPAFHAVDQGEKSVLMEDLGAVDLCGLAGRPDLPPGELARIYRLVLDLLLQLQERTPDALDGGCPPAVDRILDHDQLRWETDYFRERFLAGHLGLAAADLDGLTGEFEDLARVVAAQPRVLIHRDFQSRNIILQDDRVRLVDFQGMRLGPLGYDIMSLLWDPYVDLPAGLREELLAEFCRRTAGKHAGDEIRAMAVAAGLQRVMQALGAFGFLGHVKSKSSFLEHIPPAVLRLRDLLEESHSLRIQADERVRRWLPGKLSQLTGLVAGLGGYFPQV